MKDFFVSYNKADKGWAEWIAWELEEAGYSLVIQAWDFRPGGNFVLAMQNAAKETARTLAVLSPDYLKAEYTQPEWAAAFAKDSQGKDRKLVPVFVKNCKPEGLLAPLIRINLVGLEESTARSTLLEGVKTDRAKPTRAPAFPGAPPRAVSQQPRFPGAPARVWTVPHLRNPNFTGREELLRELRVNLMSGEPAALVQAIHGLGGVGKTQIAVEYAYLHETDYEAIMWVRSEEPTTLATDFAALSSKLGLVSPDIQDQNVHIEAVLEWLRQNSGWLLIFDNAPDAAQIVRYLPRGGKGHVLITSRNRDWRHYARTLQVRKMEPDEAIEFLLKRTGEQDRGIAARLAKELDYLPLALEQAAAYIDQRATSFSDYLSLLQKHLARAFVPSEDYPKTVAATWEVSFQAVREHSQAAADLLNLCAFFAPENIPLDMIVARAEDLPENLKNAVVDEVELDSMIGELGRYSLVEVDRDRRAVSIHRMVQAVVRDRVPSEERQRWVEAALQVVAFGFGYRINEMSTWPIAAIVLPHALAVIASSDLQEPSSIATGRLLSHLLNQVGLYLEHRAQYTDARDQLARALAIDEAVYGPDHPTVAIRLNNLGSVLQDLGDLQGARSDFERALAIDEAVYGPDHPTVAADLNNLGGVLKDLGDLQGARSNFERALAIDEAVYGPDHPTVAIRLSNLGGVLKDLGDSQGARSNFERALAIDEAAYGPDHPTVATMLNNLGMVLKDLGDLQGARSNFERALAIDEAVYGPDHPTVAIRLSNLGSVLQDLGDLQGARSDFERALAIDEAVYGPDHPTVAADLNNLGGVFQDLGDLQGARSDFERALAIGGFVYGPDHPTVAIGLANMGVLLLQLQELAMALEYLTRAHAIFANYLGPEHPYTLRAQEWFALVSRLLDREEA